jgi:hypothetical protein
MLLAFIFPDSNTRRMTIPLNFMGEALGRKWIRGQFAPVLSRHRNPAGKRRQPDLERDRILFSSALNDIEAQADHNGNGFIFKGVIRI